MHTYIHTYIHTHTVGECDEGRHHRHFECSHFHPGLCEPGGVPVQCPVERHREHQTAAHIAKQVRIYVSMYVCM